MSFKLFKDRFWGVASAGTRLVAAAPAPIGRTAFGAAGWLMWLAWIMPGSQARIAMSAFSATIANGPPKTLFSKFSKGFMLFLYRMERLRLGHHQEIDGLLDLPEADRLETLLQASGVMLVMPHTNGSLAMVRGLSQRYPVLMLVRTTRKDKRSESQHSYYEQLGCDLLDVRRASQASVARSVISALREKRIVVVTGDLIKKPPPVDAPVDKQNDLVRAEAFGQPLGAPGWPARLALRAGAPLLPVMIEQTDQSVILHLGEAARGEDVLSATNHWVMELSRLIAAHPSDWAFVFDRRWSRLLQDSARSRRTARATRAAPS